jgi:acyl carrier protein phosphodiesterase
MARQSQNKFIKRQKELERMRKAKEKMARRQSKREKLTEHDEPLTLDYPSDPSGETSGS